MNKQNCVYLIINTINNKKYVGVAKDFDKRMYQHSIGHDKDKSYIDKAILKYGGENFEVHIIDNYDSLENRKQLEQFYIKQYQTHRSQGGYNLTGGGDDTCFPNVSGENNPRSQFTEEDVRDIRERRMKGERLADVYEDYKDKVVGDKRAGFSKIWLHESGVNICPEFKGHYPNIDTKQFATIRRNELNNDDKDFLVKYFKGNGPVKYNEIYKTFKTKIDWQSFQEFCKGVVEELYGNKSTRRYRDKNGVTEKTIQQYRIELGKEPQYS